MKFTLNIVDEALWLDFRKWCLDHKTSVSKAIEPLIRQLLVEKEKS